MNIAPVTPDQVRDAAIRSGKQTIEIRQCSICEEPIGYRVHDGDLSFAPGCGCSWSPAEPREWSEASDLINMQKLPECRADIMRAFGFTETEINDNKDQKP